MIVYLLLNTLNNKGYVGQHKGNAIFTRWPKNLRGGNPHFNNAVNEYGHEIFSREILNTCTSQEEMSNLEKLWILTLRTYDPEFGYNKTFGGESGRLPGFYHSEITRKRIGNANKNKKRSPEYCRYSSLIRLGKPNPNHSRIMAGRLSSQKGKTYEEIIGPEKTIELKLNQSLQRKGKICITNGTISKRINKDALIPEGFWMGRTTKRVSNPCKGKTYTEFYGKEKAMRITANQSKAKLGLVQTPESNCKRSLSCKVATSTPEIRKQRSENMRRIWAERKAAKERD